MGVVRRLWQDAEGAVKPCAWRLSRGLLACLQRRKTLLRRESQAMINKEKHFCAGDEKKEPRERDGEIETARAGQACTRHTTSVPPHTVADIAMNRTALLVRCLFSELHSTQVHMCAG